jgi:hypothetical protein
MQQAEGGQWYHKMEGADGGQRVEAAELEEVLVLLTATHRER